ncbi:uncharacterized protein [Triticum aestivum]|uniref:uncharacterized protein isoform X2 n=1 Tax=Triticum aestivum TaxID=4565 RepID=UPI001D027957|nr:uncharacterized protein LOC123039807 isoform X2 [Triticum aestivum]
MTGYAILLIQSIVLRTKGIDMDIMWCIVDAFAQQNKHAQFSVGPDILPTTLNSLLRVKRRRSVRRKPLQKLLSMKSSGTEGVNCSITDSSLQKGDVSGRTRCPEIDTSFCSPPCELDLHRVCPTDGFNLLLVLHHIDPISVANGQSILALLTLLSMVGDCSKAAVNTQHYRIRKSRHNKGCRVLSRQCSAQKTRDHKRGDTRDAAFQKNRRLTSRSEPMSADNSSLLTPDSTPERAWRVASAAPQHMTGYLNHFTDYTAVSGDQVIDTPSMGPMVFHGSGSVNNKNMTLRDVLYVPGLEANLVSTGQLAELGYTISIGPYGCRVYKDDEGMDLVGKAHYVDGYLLELDFLRV